MKKNFATKMAPGTKEAFESCLMHIMEHQDTIVRLKKELARFEEGLSKHLSSGKVVEFEARRHLATAKALLNHCRVHSDQPFVPYCLAAIDYFLHPEDGISDFSDLDGFEDDAKVLQMVVDEFKLKLS